MVSTAPETRQVIDIPIGDLILEGNVRKTVILDKTFLSTIRADGVLDPIKVTELDDGKYAVVDGQRRVLASVDAGHPSVPALVTKPSNSDVDRLARQLILNDQRDPITDADHTAVFKEMSLFGASADQIAKKARTPRARVITALEVAGSEIASKAIAEHQMTIDEAAIFVEFESYEEAIEQLTETITTNPAQFAHETARLRKHRDEQESIRAKQNELTEAGIEVLIERPSYENKTYSAFSYWYVDQKLTTHVQLEDAPKGKLLAYVGLGWKAGGSERGAVADYYIKPEDAKEAGFFTSPGFSSSSSSTGGGLTDEQKAERKITRENNKLWAPATDVRRAFITELLARKDAPAAWEPFVVQHMIRSAGGVSDYRVRDLVPAFLGIELKLQPYVDKNPDRAPFVAIAFAFARIESGFEYAKRGWAQSESVDHLKQLSAWGYTLSDIEQAVVKGTASKGVNL